LVERYGGLNDRPPLGLIASVQISDSAAIKRLIRELNALPAFPKSGMFCPFADGSYFALVFTYRDGASTTVKVEANGCRGVFVGGSEQAVAWAVQSPELFDTFLGLLANKPTS
jgi:hypothetical protein